MLLGVLGRDLAIDLGTQNTVVFAEGRGVVLVEPTVVAVEREGGKMSAAGWEAVRALRQSPEALEAVWPLRNGSVADFAVAEWLLKLFLRKVRRRVYGRFSRPLLRPRVLLCVPAGANDLEISTIRRVAMRVGVRAVQDIEGPLAAAMGAGLAVEEAAGSMVVDIGCGKTEAAVLCLGDIVTGCSTRTGTGAMDAAISAYLRRERDLSIDFWEAERLRIELGSALLPVESGFAKAEGRDLPTGVPKTVPIDGAEVHGAIKRSVETVVEVIRRALEYSSAELVSDISERGIVLAGGGARLGMLDDLLRYKLGVPVTVAREPLECAAVGAGMMLGRGESGADERVSV